MTFSKDQMYMVMDYEVFSEAPLRGAKSVGAYEYSVHESTEIICVAWRIGTRATLRDAPTRSWRPGSTTPGYFSEFFRTLLDPSIILVSHNATFEQVITLNVFTRCMYSKEKQLRAALPPERWLCTASLASAMALPRNLEGAALALNLPVLKDMSGHKLMLKYCKPRKPTKHNPATRHTDEADLARIVQYCETDIATEVELFLTARPLSAEERRVWILDQKINLRGYCVDTELVTAVLGMIADETKALDARCAALTDGEIRSATQREKVLDWINERMPLNVVLPDLQKKTVDHYARIIGGEVGEMLWLRLATSKTSTAKYQAFKNRSASDGRVRDNFLYHGASTGRFTGTGAQIQNLPRSAIKNTDQAAEILKTGDLDWIRLMYGEPMQVFSDCLRSVIVASPGKVFDCADYASIEARVIFWMAKHEAGLQAFRDGRDLYRELAATIFNTKPELVTSGQRWVGKSAILGCCYGMGHKKFLLTCAAQGQAVSEDVAKAAVAGYRETHAPVPRLWSLLEQAAIAAVQNPGKKYTINRTAWWADHNVLWCALPSGRRLAYYGPCVKYELPFWAKSGNVDKVPVLYHFSVNPLTKKWELDKTRGPILCENCVQATARDLLAAAMLRLEAAGWEIALHVHDEIVAEVAPFGASHQTFCDLMAETPAWAEGLPVRVEGFRGVRYRK